MREKKNRVPGGETRISRPVLTNATEQGNESLAAAARVRELRTLAPG
jgi:hypothetical protein